ncbi:response regulator transcription factor [Candidatus Omnitrophota bacterium]
MAAGKKIVLIEDEGELVLLIRNHLEDRGFKVECFQSGKEGINAIKISMPDLVLLDLKLPDMSGKEIYTQLRLGEHTKDIPVIFVTASTLISDIENAFRIGVDDYVCKPIELDVLLSKVKKVLKIK